jgi:glycerophosphoryl diester phosphodiesterase
MVELDVRQTRDGELICLHDDTFDRTTNAFELFGKKGLRPEDLTLAQTAKLDAGLWKAPEHRGAGVPTLGDALDAIQGRSIAMVEHKACDPVRVVEMLKRKGLTRKVVVQSFDWKWLERVRMLDPSICLAALGKDELTEERLLEARRIGAGILHWSARSLTIEAAEKAIDAGFVLFVYTVDDQVSWLGAWAMGVGGITTDQPGGLKALIQAGRFGAAP